MMIRGWMHDDDDDDDDNDDNDDYDGSSLDWYLIHLRQSFSSVHFDFNKLLEQACNTGRSGRSGRSGRAGRL